MDTSDKYVNLAQDAIIALLKENHAAVWPEIEAKLAEHEQPGFPRGINPHILTSAKHALLEDARLVVTVAATKGGREVTVYSLPASRGTLTATSRAAARKRLLQT